MPHFYSIKSFYRNRPKIKLFLPTNIKFLGAGGSAPHPRKSATPSLSPNADFWLRACMVMTEIIKNYVTLPETDFMKSQNLFLQ